MLLEDAKVCACPKCGKVHKPFGYINKIFKRIQNYYKCHDCGHKWTKTIKKSEA